MVEQNAVVLAVLIVSLFVVCAMLNKRISLLQDNLNLLDAYTERNIKRIDGELEILNSDVDDLSDTTWNQHVEIERLKMSPLQRWARGVVRGWVE